MKLYRIKIEGRDYQSSGRNAAYALSKLIGLPVKAIASTTQVNRTSFIVSLFINGKLKNFPVVLT